MKRINMEEAFHFKSGEDMVLTLMGGTARQKQMAQEAFDRWWEPCLMFFGPPDKDSVKTTPFMRWRIKTATNDELRQQFVDRFTPAALDLGIKIHISVKDEHGIVKRKPTGEFDQVEDPELRYDSAAGQWRFSEPKWEEFYRVIRGGGPCNKERLALRRFSYEQGQWVRRAVIGSSALPPG
jgi:ring-1,2-phenylacetyl-CoA epoxidase subunit PaaA